jgi:hypothetical protein
LPVSRVSRAEFLRLSLGPRLGLELPVGATQVIGRSGDPCACQYSQLLRSESAGGQRDAIGLAEAQRPSLWHPVRHQCGTPGSGEIVCRQQLSRPPQYPDLSRRSGRETDQPGGVQMRRREGAICGNVQRRTARAVVRPVPLLPHASERGFPEAVVTSCRRRRIPGPSKDGRSFVPNPTTRLMRGDQALLMSARRSRSMPSAGCGRSAAGRLANGRGESGRRPEPTELSLSAARAAAR